MSLTSPEARILQDSEGALLKALSSVDAVKLCVELLRHRLVSKSVKNSFESLDHGNVEIETRIRYLLRLVNNKVEKDSGCFKDFLKVLVKMQLKEPSDHLSEELRKWELLNEVNPDFTSEKGRKRRHANLGSRILVDNDVVILAEVLSDCSHKWEEIGICLRLKQCEIKECGQATSFILKLSSIFTRWLESTSLHTVPANLDSLSKVLRSNIVGMPDVADKLVQRFCDKICETTICKPKKVCQCSPLRITYQSTDLEIENGKAALLEVRVEGSEPVNYQWKKDGQKLCEGTHFFHVDGPFLLIKSANVEVEGIYSCTVSCSNNNRAESDSVSLSVSYPSITQYFFDIYSKFDELPKDSWPPVTSTSFINLALITKKKLNSEIFDYTVQGDIDDILEEKEKIEYEELFGKYEIGTLLLVEGRPGSGKTTLMHKVTRDWSLKKEILVGAKLVILIPLRLFSSFNNDLQFLDIIQHYINNGDEIQEILSHIDKCRGKGVCFIIDGLDEYQLRDNTKNTINKLMLHKLFPNSMVIVASRPAGSAKLRVKGKVSKRVEVLGFSKKEIFSYIEKYRFEEVEVAAKLVQYLNRHNKVLHMCYLPVHAAMICYLYSEMGDNIPQTETKIYETFTISSVKRILMRENELLHENFCSMEDLESDLQTQYYKICELAFTMTVASKQAIHQKDTAVSLSSAGSDSLSLGLVTIDSAAKLFKSSEEFYTYLHLTFQEYLASVYLTKLDKDELLRIIDLHKDKPEFTMVWRFLSGSINFSNKICLLDMLLSSKSMDTMSKVLCGFESQQQEVCDYLLQSGTLYFKDHNFLASDFVAISFVMYTSQHFLTRLELLECSVDEEGISLMIENLTSEHFNKITYLGFNKKNCTVSQFKVLNKLLQILPSLKILNLEETDLSKSGIMELTSGVHLPYLKSLQIKIPLKPSVYGVKILQKMKFNSKNLDHVQFQLSKSKKNETTEVDFDCQVLYEVFEDSLCWNPRYPLINNLSGHIRFIDYSNCSDLVLVNCGIEDHHIETLVKSLATYNQLKVLKLDFNNISGEGATLLASSFEKFSSIKTFSAHCNQIDDYGALELVKTFANLQSLVRILDLQCNAISKKGVLAVIEVARNISRNFQLYITVNTLGFANSNLNYVDIQLLYASVQGIWKGNSVAKAKALMCCKFVPEVSINSTNNSRLNLQWTAHGDIGTLVEGLKLCKNTVDIVICKQSANTKAIPLYNQCSRSQHLQDYVGIGSSGATIFADALKNWTNIHTLNLCDNEIGSSGAEALAAALKNCTSIHTLNLGLNDIGSSGAEALAAALKNCTSIHTFNLGLNDIGSSGAEALAAALKNCTSIHTLDLDDNGIGSSGAEALAAALKNCTSIHTLNLVGNGIGSSGAEALAAALKNCTNVHSLNLYYNRIGSSGAEALAAALKNCTSIHTLNLGLNDIGSSGAEALAAALKNCTSIHTLNLSGNGIGSSGAEALAAALKNCTSIHTLNLSGNGIGSSGAEALAAALKHCTSIHTLNLGLNDIGSSGAEALAAALKNCTSIHTLNLGLNDIGSSGAEALAAALKNCTSIHTLNLGGNGIGSSGAEALAAALKNCTSIHTLDLDDNGIGSSGAEALAAALKNCTSIHTLNLVGNGIGSSGAEALAAALKNCTNVHSLNLYYNRIGSSGAEALAAALKNCTSIHTLNLGLNDIGSSGAEALAAALKNCTSIHTLNLGLNDIGSSGAEALAAALKNCTSINTLNLGGNEIGSSGAASLAAAVKNCTSILI